jgi:hypothetical protein
MFYSTLKRLKMYVVILQSSFCVKSLSASRSTDMTSDTQLGVLLFMSGL